jgi:hypothetical protein
MSRVRCTVVGWVAACCAALMSMGLAGAALADGAPDLSLSRLSCAPENAAPPALGSTRPGDYVVCQLKAANLGTTIAYHVTAEVTIPAGTAYAPPPNAQGIPLPAGAPTRVLFDESKLGLIDELNPKPASVRLRVLDDAAPGTPIQPVATVRDPAAATVLATANALSVMPQKADLSPSGVACANADPAKADVRAGDTLDCRFVLAGRAAREDATQVTLSAGIPTGTEWAPGGNDSFHFGSNLNWFAGVLPDGVRSGATADPVLDVHLHVLPATLGGTVLYVNGTLDWVNVLSGEADSLGVGSGAIVITPGPAVLTPSGLTCADDDGPPLLAQDLVTCTVAIRPAAGHEDLAAAAGSGAVPALTTAVTPADGSGRIPLIGLPPTIGAGTVKVATYRLRVAAGAVAGNVIVPTAVVTGRSTPSGEAIGQPLAAAPLVVGTRPVAAPPAGSTPAAGAAAVTAASTPAASRAPVICGSRRTVVVNVRPPRGQRWKAVTFAFATKSVKGRKATGSRGKKGYYSAKLVFQGLPKGPLKVAIKGVTTKGKTVRSSRTYTLCAPKKG